MVKKAGAIFFLLGFLIFSFAGTICLTSKMKAQEVAALIGTIAEEEDETEKDSKSESDDFIELLEAIEFNYITIANRYISQSVDTIPVFNPNILIQPPESFTV